MNRDMTAPQQSRSVPLTRSLEDVDMEPTSLPGDDTDSVPDLMEMSDSSDSSSEYGSARSMAADEQGVMMLTMDNSQNPSRFSSSHESLTAHSPVSTILEPRPAVPRSNNRRPRVEDDEDEERDRRHPSQRVSSPSSNSFPESHSASQTSPSPSPSLSQPPPQPRQASRTRTAFNLPSLTRLGLDQADPLRFFQHLMPQTQGQPNNPSQSVANDINAANNDTAPQPPQPTNINGIPNAPPTTQDQPRGNDNEGERADVGLFTEIMMRLGLLGALFAGGISAEPEGDDPKRARKLVDGLEEVPIGLVKRLERVGGTDDPDGGRDTMCAICWDQLLDEAGFGKKPELNDAPPQSQTDPSSSSTTPSSPRSLTTAEGELEEYKCPTIVALPCAHVFHADCLVPWFSRPRQTTCPSCRFNIDPENLTRTRRRGPAPMWQAQPNAAGDAGRDQAQGPPEGDNAQAQLNNVAMDNANPETAGRNGDGNPNRAGAHFVIDVPIIVAAPPFVSFNGGPPGAGNAAANAQGLPDNMLDQIRVAMEERLRGRAGQGNQQPSTGNNSGPNNNTANPDAPPPTQPATPAGSPPPRLPQPTSQAGTGNDQGVTHSIVLGFDVLVGGQFGPALRPQPDGNTMDVDEGAGNRNGDGGQDWFGMTMRDIFSSRGTGPAANTNNAAAGGNTGGTNAGQNNANAEAPQNGRDARPNPGFSRVVNMTLGNGESLHIASGMGRTMGEAMTQMLNSMGGAGNHGPTNPNPGQNAAPNTNTNTTTNGGSADAAASDSGDAPRNDSGAANRQNQAQDQNRQNQQGGMFATIGSLPFQVMAQMFGFGSPVRGQNQGQNQSPEPNSTTAPVSPPEAEQDPQIANPAPNNNSQPSEQDATPHPTIGNNPEIDEGVFTRFIRNFTSGNIPAAPTASAGGNAGQDENDAAPPLPPHIEFFPPGFTMRGNAPPSAPSNTSPSEKRQWTPPPAPGPTLRERIEKREREIGLRCCDMSCGVGPSDDDPLIFVTEEGMKQLMLKSVNGDGSTEEDAKMCLHTFHPSCLVSAERVALRGADAAVVGDDVEVSCSVCRAIGRVSRREWNEGVQQLS